MLMMGAAEIQPYKFDVVARVPKEPLRDRHGACDGCCSVSLWLTGIDCNTKLE